MLCGNESTCGISSCCGVGRGSRDEDEGVVVVSRRGGGERVRADGGRDALEVGGVKSTGSGVVSSIGCDV